jgi:predicted transcriptional regulator
MNVVTILVDVGFNPPIAKTLAHFLKAQGKLVTSRDIEKATDSRQPEINLALKELKKRKWISVKEPLEKKEGKGNRTKWYSLSITPEAIYLDIEKGMQKDIRQLETTLKELKAAMISPKPAVKEQEQLPIGV